MEVWGLDAILDVAYEGALWCVFQFYRTIRTIIIMITMAIMIMTTTITMTTMTRYPGGAYQENWRMNRLLQLAFHYGPAQVGFRMVTFHYFGDD